MTGRFAGKVVLIAGGTGGLGRAVSEAFLREGATVAVTYRKKEEFDALAEAVGGAADALMGFAADVTNEAAVAVCVGTLLAHYERLDVLVNAVGGYAGGAPLWEPERMCWSAC